MKKFSIKLADNILKKVINFLKEEEIFSDSQKISIKVAEVSKKEIQELNQLYRGKKEPTDILSFGYNSNKNEIEGDLILCWNVISKNAEEDGISSEKELMKNLIHGCLHLAGFEHSDEMFKLQKIFLEKNEL